MKKLAGDSMIYGMSGIVTRMISIFLVPIYTRLFTPEDYGTINLINTTFMLISLFLVCALDNSAARWFYDTEDVIEQKKTFGSWIWFQFFLSIIACVILIFLSPFIASKLLKLPGKEILIIVPAITLITSIMPNILTNWYRVHRKAKNTVVFTLSQSLFTILLTIIFVIVLKLGIIGVFSALAISSTIFSMIAVQQMWQWLSISYFDKLKLKEMLRFALPMIPAALAYWILNSTDSYFIAFFKNKYEVGLFGVGAMLASSISLFTGAFQQAWGPFAFSIINNEDAKYVYAKVFLYYAYIMGFLAACLMIFAPEVLMIFTTKAYYSSAWVSGILGYNLVLIGFSYIAMIGISAIKTTTPYAVGMLMATIATVVLDIILIPSFGKEGSAVATLFAQLIVPVYIFYKGQKVYPIPFDFKKVIFIMISSLIFGVAIRCITFNNLTTQIVVKIISILLALTILILINISAIREIKIKKFR